VGGHAGRHPRLGDGRRETLPGSAEQEHQALIAACLDPSVWLMSELLHACRGQRPADEARSAKAAR
jgi:hypothetical protein